jgi:hypothetical protein
MRAQDGERATTFTNTPTIFNTLMPCFTTLMPCCKNTLQYHSDDELLYTQCLT